MIGFLRESGDCEISTTLHAVTTNGSSMATNGPGTVQTVDSASNHGPLVNIIAWVGIVTCALAILARMGTKWALQRKASLDDGAIGIAFVGVLVVPL